MLKIQQLQWLTVVVAAGAEVVLEHGEVDGAALHGVAPRVHVLGANSYNPLNGLYLRLRQKEIFHYKRMILILKKYFLTLLKQGKFQQVFSIAPILDRLVEGL